MQICSTTPPKSKLLNQDSPNFKDPPDFYVSTTTPPQCLSFTTETTSTTMLFHRISDFVRLNHHWSSTGTIHLTDYHAATRSTFYDCGFKLPNTGSKYAVVEPPDAADSISHFAANRGLWVFGPRPPI